MSGPKNIVHVAIGFKGSHDARGRYAGRRLHRLADQPGPLHRLRADQRRLRQAAEGNRGVPREARQASGPQKHPPVPRRRLGL